MWAPPYYNGSDDLRTFCLLCTDIALWLTLVVGFWGTVRPYQTACSQIAGHWISEKSAVLFPGRSFSAVGFGKEQLGYDGIGVYGIIAKMGSLKRSDIFISSREDGERSMRELLEELLWRA